MEITDLSTFSDGTADFQGFLDSLCDSLAVDYAAYVTVNSPSESLHTYTNYPTAWKQAYSEMGFHNFDPALWKSARRIAPTDWSSFQRDDKFREIFNTARDFGITDQGMTVPVRGPYGDCGLLSVTRDCSEEKWIKLRGSFIKDLQVAAVHFHDAVIRSEVLTHALRTPTLSKREREVIHWTAAGKIQQDIADILSISQRTVEVHLRSAREKLGALTTAQAVARAVSLGIVGSDYDRDRYL